MKICIFTGIFPPDIGGPAGYVKKVAEEFSRKGIGVSVLTYTSLTNSGKGLNFQVEGVSRKYPKIIRHLLYLMRGFRLAKGADAIYAQNLFSVGIPALIISIFRKKRLVVKVVGDYAWEKSLSFEESSGIDDFQNQRHSCLVGIIVSMQSYLASRASRIIVPSNYLKEIVVGWGVPKEKIRVIYNVPESFPENNISKEQAKKHIRIGGNILLSIGRLSPWKGFAKLVEVVAELARIIPDVRLIIVGDGEERTNLEDLIKKMNLEDKVNIIGKIPHEEIPFYLKAADVFVLNSEYEGLSHAILEAMQAGVPVVVSNRGGNPELIQDGFNGFLVEYNNEEQIKTAVSKLFQDKELARRFAENSRRKLASFNWDNLLEKTLKVLQEEN